MKKFLLVGMLFLATAGFSNSVFAAGYGDAGCGLGSIVFGNEGGGVQILASTTNGTFGSQTFGMTTGTSNCSPEGLVMLDKEREIFAQKNYSSIVKEMAVGEGENLETLAGLFGCSQDTRSEFGSLVQENFGSIVTSDTASSNEMLIHLKSQLLDHATLSKSCVAVIG